MTPGDLQALPSSGIMKLVSGLDIPYSDHESIIHEVATRLPTKDGKFRIHLFRDREGREHIALVKGDVAGRDDVLTRVHSECMTGDLFGSLRCDCGPQLHHAMRMVNEVDVGMIIYLRQEGRGIGLSEKLKAYNLQDMGYDTVDANIILGHKAEERDYSVARDMIKALGVGSIRLISNNPDKVRKLTRLGIEVSGRVTIEPDINPDNLPYLRTKIDRMGHRLDEGDLVPHMPQMDDVVRYVARARDEKRGVPFFTSFQLSALDGILEEDPETKDGSYRTLRKKLMRAHDAFITDLGHLIADRGAVPTDVTCMSFDPEQGSLSCDRRTAVVLSTGGDTGQTHPITDDDGILSFERLSELMISQGIGSALVDGRSKVFTMLRDQGMIDVMVDVVVPIVGGEKASSSDRGLEFKDVRAIAMGTEVAYFGMPKRI